MGKVAFRGSDQEEAEGVCASVLLGLTPLGGGGPRAAGWALHPSTSVSGPQELVTQVFAILLEYLMSPDSSPTVRA